MKCKSGPWRGDCRVLWQAADKLRGTIDAAKYKHVVLGLLALRQAAQRQPQLRLDSALHPPPVLETTCVNLAGYIATHPAGQQYSGYWTPSEVQQADLLVTKP